MYEHISMKNIKKLYKTAGKCNDKHKYKEMIEAAIVSTHQGCTNISLMTPNPYMYSKHPSARKPPRQFPKTLDVKHNNAFRRIVESKANHRANKKGNVF